MEMSLQVHMINVHLGFLEEFSMDRIGPGGVYFFMALPLVFTICGYFKHKLCTNFAYLNRATLQKLDLAHSISISASHSSVRYALLAACQMAAVLKRLGAIGIYWDTFTQLTMQNLPDLIFIF